MITQVRVDENDPAFENPSKPIGRFLTKEQADEMAEKYNYIMKEDAGRGIAVLLVPQSHRKS